MFYSQIFGKGVFSCVSYYFDSCNLHINLFFIFINGCLLFPYCLTCSNPFLQLPLIAVTSITDGLKRLYNEKLKPLELTYRFNDFVSPSLVSLISSDVFSRIYMILLVLLFIIQIRMGNEIWFALLSVTFCLGRAFAKFMADLFFCRLIVILMLSLWSCFWDNIQLEKQHLSNIC